MFATLQVELEDRPEANVLAILPSCVNWIENEIGKGKDVLVHCQVCLSSSDIVVHQFNDYPSLQILNDVTVNALGHWQRSSKRMNLLQT